VSLFGEVARAELLKPEDRLNLPDIVNSIQSQGKEAKVIADPDDMAAAVAAKARSGDVVAILSNGGFGGVHEKVLVALSNASA